MSERRTAADLAALRREYGDRGLDTPDLAPDPIEMFGRWFDDTVAAGLHEPNAMVVTTVSGEGRPSTRMVLLKGIDERGFVFYTNYGSRKARDIEANPAVSLLFPWHDLQRQVRVEGTALAGLPGGQRGVLRVPAARVAARRLGLPAVAGGVVARRAATRCTAARRSGSPTRTTSRCRRTGAASASGPTWWSSGRDGVGRMHDRLVSWCTAGTGNAGSSLAWPREVRLRPTTKRHCE